MSSKKKYTVWFTRDMQFSASVIVEAGSRAKAETIAFEQVNDLEFKADDWVSGIEVADVEEAQ